MFTQIVSSPESLFHAAENLGISIDYKKNAT